MKKVKKLKLFFSLGLIVFSLIGIVLGLFLIKQPQSWWLKADKDGISIAMVIGQKQVNPGEEFEVGLMLVNKDKDDIYGANLVLVYDSKKLDLLKVEEGDLNLFNFRLDSMVMVEEGKVVIGAHNFGSGILPLPEPSTDSGLLGRAKFRVKPGVAEGKTGLDLFFNEGKTIDKNSSFVVGFEEEKKPVNLLVISSAVELEVLPVNAGNVIDKISVVYKKGNLLLAVTGVVFIFLGLGYLAIMVFRLCAEKGWFKNLRLVRNKHLAVLGLLVAFLVLTVSNINRTQYSGVKAGECKKDITEVYNPACCCGDNDCPDNQKCDIANGYCKSGLSCNPDTGEVVSPTSTPELRDCSWGKHGEYACSSSIQCVECRDGSGYYVSNSYCVGKPCENVVVIQPTAAARIPTLTETPVPPTPSPTLRGCGGGEGINERCCEIWEDDSFYCNPGFSLDYSPKQCICRAISDWKQECRAGEERCEGKDFQVCSSSNLQWVTIISCAVACEGEGELPRCCGTVNRICCNGDLCGNGLSCSRGVCRRLMSSISPTLVPVTVVPTPRVFEPSLSPILISAVALFECDTEDEMRCVLIPGSVLKRPQRCIHGIWENTAACWYDCFGDGDCCGEADGQCCPEGDKCHFSLIVEETEGGCFCRQQSCDPARDGYRCDPARDGYRQVCNSEGEWEWFGRQCWFGCFNGECCGQDPGDMCCANGCSRGLTCSNDGLCVVDSCPVAIDQVIEGNVFGGDGFLRKTECSVDGKCSVAGTGIVADLWVHEICCGVGEVVCQGLSGRMCESISIENKCILESECSSRIDEWEGVPTYCEGEGEVCCAALEYPTSGSDEYPLIYCPIGGCEKYCEAGPDGCVQACEEWCELDSWLDPGARDRSCDDLESFGGCMTIGKAVCMWCEGDACSYPGGEQIGNNNNFEGCHNRE